MKITLSTFIAAGLLIIAGASALPSTSIKNFCRDNDTAVIGNKTVILPNGEQLFFTQSSSSCPNAAASTKRSSTLVQRQSSNTSCSEPGDVTCFDTSIYPAPSQSDCYTVSWQLRNMPDAGVLLVQVNQTWSLTYNTCQTSITNLGTTPLEYCFASWGEDTVAITNQCIAAASDPAGEWLFSSSNLADAYVNVAGYVSP